MTGIVNGVGLGGVGKWFNVLCAWWCYWSWRFGFGLKPIGLPLGGPELER